MPASSSGDDVLDRAVGGVAGHLAGPELAAEADPPEQVPQRHVLHHVGRGHQGGEDDARLAAVDDVVVVVAQARPVPGPHRRGVGVGRADPEVGRAPVAADRRPVRVQPPLLQQLPGRTAPARPRLVHRPRSAAGRRPSGRASAAASGSASAASVAHRRRRDRRRGSWPRGRSGGRSESRSALARTLVAST